MKFLITSTDDNDSSNTAYNFTIHELYHMQLGKQLQIKSCTIKYDDPTVLSDLPDMLLITLSGIVGLTSSYTSNGHAYHIAIPLDVFNSTGTVTKIFQHFNDYDVNQTQNNGSRIARIKVEVKYQTLENNYIDFTYLTYLAIEFNV
ncbi:MAG: hypothetical protein N2B06_01805 [Clostridium sp.]